MSGKIIIGVTGEIGAGKTTFVAELERYGAYPLYSDDIAHEILKFQKVQEKLRKYFGSDIFEKGRLNIRRLSSLGFKNKENWQKLINATHPYILKKLLKIIESSKEKYFAIDAPLLFESGLDKYCDYIVIVKAENILRKKRYKKLNWKEILKRSSYLLPLVLKEKMADFIVINNQSKRRLEENAQKIWFRIQNK